MSSQKRLAWIGLSVVSHLGAGRSRIDSGSCHTGDCKRGSCDFLDCPLVFRGSGWSVPVQWVVWAAYLPSVICFLCDHMTLIHKHSLTPVRTCQTLRTGGSDWLISSKKCVIYFFLLQSFP